MKKNLAMMLVGLGALGLVSSVSIAKEGRTTMQIRYELTKACKKGYVKNKMKKCVKLTCDAKHYMNAAKTKCLPKRTMGSSSRKDFK